VRMDGEIEHELLLGEERKECSGGRAMVVLSATTMRAVGQVRRQGRPNSVASPSSKLSLHIPPKLLSHILAP
jgi:hypothetical protein